MTALLTPLRKGFLLLNRWVAAPLIRAGGGPLLTTPVAGSILLLRTTGRKSGLVREAPLGYAVIAGRVVVVAGYGRSAHWFLNAWPILRSRCCCREPCSPDGQMRSPNWTSVGPPSGPSSSPWAPSADSRSATCEARATPRWTCSRRPFRSSPSPRPLSVRAPSTPAGLARASTPHC